MNQRTVSVPILQRHIGAYQVMWQEFPEFHILLDSLRKSGSLVTATITIVENGQVLYSHRFPFAWNLWPHHVWTLIDKMWRKRSNRMDLYGMLLQMQALVLSDPQLNPLGKAEHRLNDAAGKDYTTPSLIAARREMWGGRCYVCGAPATAIDHVKPVARGGAHWPCNLRPICKSCNSRKGTKWPFAGLLRKAEVER
jgi:hypothetical protein